MMLRIKTYEEIKSIPDPALRDHIEHKALELMQEYDIADLNEVGCFVILDAEEADQFIKEGMEFVERVVLAGTEYLHGVHIIGDCYGEDIYLTMIGGKQHV